VSAKNSVILAAMTDTADLKRDFIQ
jgi:hypothetical protein